MKLTSILGAAMALTLSLSLAQAWVPPIVTKGNKFFNSETGVEFRMKGIAYYPRPNAGKLALAANYDWAKDEHEDVWRPHLELLQELGVNTIRLYSVDPSESHDKFMCAASEAGIYVLVGMAAPCKDCSIIDELPPKCYADGLFTRIQMVYNAFAVYDNTLGFSVGNENNLQIAHGADGTATAPCVKALLRDARAYAASCAGNLRQVPIGLDIADIPPRAKWIQYYDCELEDDDATRAEWIGFNPYVECDPQHNLKYEDSEGLQQVMAEYGQVGYSRPIMFGEYGCNMGENTVDGYENQRAFHDAKWMNEAPQMTTEIVGGNVFEFSTEIANLVNKEAVTKEKDPGKFGLGYFTPEDCDHITTPCEFNRYPEFENLKAAYTSTIESNVTLTNFSPTRTETLTCPTGISTDLPATPGVDKLACSALQPKCNGVPSNVRGGGGDAKTESETLEATASTAENEDGVLPSTPAITTTGRMTSFGDDGF